MTEPINPLKPGEKRICKRKGCRKKVTGISTKKYCSSACYPSSQRRFRNHPGKIKSCACPLRELFFDTTPGYQRMYKYAVECRGRAKAKANWKHMTKLADKSKNFRSTVCVGRGIDGKGITLSLCENFTECSDSLCDGGNGLFLHEKNGGVDCYSKGKGVSANTMGSSFAECHQN